MSVHATKVLGIDVLSQCTGDVSAENNSEKKILTLKFRTGEAVRAPQQAHRHDSRRQHLCQLADRDHGRAQPRLRGGAPRARAAEYSTRAPPRGPPGEALRNFDHRGDQVRHDDAAGECVFVFACKDCEVTRFLAEHHAPRPARELPAGARADLARPSRKQKAPARAAWHLQVPGCEWCTTRITLTL